MVNREPVIDWNAPPPRKGFLNGWDTFIGTGATQAENALVVAVAVVSAIGMIAYVLSADPGWTALQVVIAVVLALDIGGGVIANATSVTKRWYHRPGQTAKTHLGFIAVHALHLLPVPIWFRPGDWGYFVIAYGYLLMAAILILRVPLYLQRPVAMLLWMGGILLNAYVIMPVAGLEWLLPAFYAKLLVAHLVREEPYRPYPTGNT